MMRYAKWLLFGSWLGLAACGVKTNDNRSHGKPGDAGPVEGPTGSDAKQSLTGVNIDHKVLLREFSAVDNDRGALFIITHDADGEIVPKKILGQRFLAEHRRVGKIDREFMATVFADSAQPISDSRREKIVDSYAGSLAVYFEGYEGALCSGETTELVVRATLLENDVDFRFQFSATPTVDGDCKFRHEGMFYSH